jgi:hypothetical protein
MIATSRGPGIALIVFLGTAAAAQTPPAATTVRLVPGPKGELARATFDLIGLGPADLALLARDAGRRDADGWNAIFSVGVDRAAPLDADARPVMLGTHAVVGKALRFTPRFPLVPGLRYRAVFDPARLPPGSAGTAGGRTGVLLTLPAPAPGAPARVARIDPPAGTIPENTLKLYLHFSAPMSRGQAYEHVQLLDGDGRPVELPFLELGEELWDRAGTRLTLLFDPGRIKSGLVPRVEDGPILVAGRSYTVRVDPSWPDANGRPLGAPFEARYTAGPADATPPDPTGWAVARPAAGTRGPLVVTAPEPLDRALLESAVGLVDGAGVAVPGRVETDARATTWRFTPDRPWAAGGYRLVVATILEDLAGNGVGRPFEVDADRPLTATTPAETVSLPVTIPPAR